MDEEESLEVMKMLAMPAARELQVAFLEHLASCWLDQTPQAGTSAGTLKSRRAFSLISLR